MYGKQKLAVYLKKSVRRYKVSVKKFNIPAWRIIEPGICREKRSKYI